MTIHTRAPHLSTLVLPMTTSMPEVVARCRRAALDFSNHAHTFTRPHLADWLSGAYRACAGTGSDPLVAWNPIPLLEQLDARMVSRLVQVSGSEVRDVLAKIVVDGGQPFGTTMIADGLVRPCRDSEGREGYLPTYRARRLTDMVLALFAADYLTCPSDYELDLSICRYCGVVGIDLESRTRGHCGRHASAFCVRRVGEGPTYLPEGA